jgi:hypothetical protein
MIDVETSPGSVITLVIVLPGKVTDIVEVSGGWVRVETTVLGGRVKIDVVVTGGSVMVSKLVLTLVIIKVCVMTWVWVGPSIVTGLVNTLVGPGTVRVTGVV